MIKEQEVTFKLTVTAYHDGDLDKKRTPTEVTRNFK